MCNFSESHNHNVRTYYKSYKEKSFYKFLTALQIFLWVYHKINHKKTCKFYAELHNLNEIIRNR